MRPLQELNKLAFSALKDRHPLVPAHALPNPKYSDRTANGLTKCILDFLKLEGWQAERISNTGRVIDNRKKVIDVIGKVRTFGTAKYIPGTGTNGTSDISATVKGRSVKIEVKIGADRQSKAQQQYQRQIEASGGIYYIARDFESFYQWYCRMF